MTPADQRRFPPLAITLRNGTPAVIRPLAATAWYRWKAGVPASGFGICIARTLQGRGAGQQLMARLLEIALTVGPPVMSLTVQKKNPKGVELYAKMGFRVIREQVRAADGEPEYYMERPMREGAEVKSA